MQERRVRISRSKEGREYLIKSCSRHSRPFPCPVFVWEWDATTRKMLINCSDLQQQCAGQGQRQIGGAHRWGLWRWLCRALLWQGARRSKWGLAGACTWGLQSHWFWLLDSIPNHNSHLGHPCLCDIINSCWGMRWSGSPGTWQWSGHHPEQVNRPSWTTLKAIRQQ